MTSGLGAASQEQELMELGPFGSLSEDAAVSLGRKQYLRLGGEGHADRTEIQLCLRKLRNRRGLMREQASQPPDFSPQFFKHRASGHKPGCTLHTESVTACHRGVREPSFRAAAPQGRSARPMFGAESARTSQALNHAHGAFQF